MIKSLKFFIIVILISNVVYAENEIQPATTQAIPITQIVNYDNYPQAVKNIIAKALILSQKNLTYLYGSADPKNAGMDCSGTMYYLLTSMGIKSVPRQSSDIYLWVLKNGHFHATNTLDFNSPEFNNLKPGDLLFWSGTYAIKRDPPITHVMLYLGKNMQGEPLMFGASNGRTYQGKKMWGVSVFDFKLPDGKSSSKFEGYSCIPELTCD